MGEHRDRPAAHLGDVRNQLDDPNARFLVPRAGIPTSQAISVSASVLVAAIVACDLLAANPDRPAAGRPLGLGLGACLSFARRRFWPPSLPPH